MLPSPGSSSFLSSWNQSTPSSLAGGQLWNLLVSVLEWPSAMHHSLLIKDTKDEQRVKIQEPERQKFAHDLLWGDITRTSARWPTWVSPTEKQIFSFKLIKSGLIEISLQWVPYSIHHGDYMYLSEDNVPVQKMQFYVLLSLFCFFVVVLFQQYWVLNLRPHTCYPGALPFEHSASPAFVRILDTWNSKCYFDLKSPDKFLKFLLPFLTDHESVWSFLWSMESPYIRSKHTNKILWVSYLSSISHNVFKAMLIVLLNRILTTVGMPFYKIFTFYWMSYIKV
jgi:hypothetical protein